MTKSQIAIRVDAAGATAYMTRDAILKLIDKLALVAAADPSECFEVHLGMEFSLYDDNDNLVLPTVVYGDGLKPAKFDAPADAPDASPLPFEVTLMHVGQDTVEELSREANS